MAKGISADLRRTLRLIARAASFTSSSADIDLVMPFSLLLLGLWSREREEEEEECMGIFQELLLVATVSNIDLG